jgi:SMC interacting uncharacterized protein involved in chromosome segregation
MDVASFLQLASILIGGGGLIGSLILLPKIRAEARKINVQTDDLIILRLNAEIERLDRDMAELRANFAEAVMAASKREAELEKENRQLRGRVAELERRLRTMESALSSVFKVEPNTAEFNSLLDQASAAEARLKRGRR